jgi:peroxiredoxin
MISKKLNIVLGFILFFFGSTTLFAKSHIQVNFPGAENQKAVVWTYNNLISLERAVIAEVDIDSKGNFSFDTYNSSTKMYYIEIRYFRISFYIEPKQQYEIQINKVDFSNRDFYPKLVVGYLSPQYRIIKPSKPELNDDLDSLNQYFDEFIQKNHYALRMGHESSKLVDTLQVNVNKFLEDKSNTFIKSYAEIQFVQLRMLTNQYGNDWVVKNYFDPRKIAYNNPAYMSFFNSFWSKYITSKVSNSIRKRLDSVINLERSYQALSALLAEDSFLVNPELRELVILSNISQLYRMPDFDKKAIISILYDISASKYSKEHQRIAVSLRKRLELLSSGNKAPDFEFIDSRNDTISLESLKGKYIYIQFWDDECIECLSQMKFTKELYEKFDDIITFIHISLDRSESDMMKIIENEDYKWHFVFLKDNYHFLKNYNVSVLPRSILIDKEGNFIAWDARMPTNYFEDYFLKMLNDNKGNLEIKTQMRNGYRP